jgi:hypothetical protein
MRPLSLAAVLLFAVGCNQSSPVQPDPASAAAVPSDGQGLRSPDADQGGRPLSTALTGAAEVPGPGDPDGAGTATITLNHGQGQVCFELTVANITTATAAHIHVAPVGVAGPVVVGLTPPVPESSAGCVGVDPDLVKAILQSPSAYYINVHNAEFPAGAVRGQLMK